MGGATVNIAAGVAIMGGYGGEAGSGTSGSGAGGEGGVGIEGQNPTVNVNGGTVAGGSGGGDETRANAFNFTGGANTLTFGEGSTLTGGIAVAGTLDLAQTDAFTIGEVISGSGAISKSGTGTLTLSGANTYTGGTSITGGTLQVGADANLGVGGRLTLSSATLATTASFNSGRTVSLSGTGTFDVAADTTLRLAARIEGAGGLAKTGEGKLTLSGTNVYTGATTVSAGTLSLAGGAAIADTSAVTVEEAATLDLVASETVGSLAGAGSVTLGERRLTAGRDNTSTTYSGVMSGRAACPRQAPAR